MRRREAVRGAAPRKHELERQVGEVGDRPVGVAVAVSGWEAAAVEALPVGDAVGPHDARVADVDDVRVDDVEPDAEADEEDEATRSQPAGTSGTSGPARGRGRSPASSIRASR